MYTTLLAAAQWFHPATSTEQGTKRAYWATFFIALGAIVGWPFSAALGIPFVLEQLFLTGGEVVVDSEKPAWKAARWERMIKAVGLAATIAVRTGGEM
jgi:alpha-1,2-mannosyltransferase